MLFLSEIVRAGITTVVGTLGVDTTMKTMAGLLARVKGLADEGITTRMWTGGYNVPPTTVMGTVREDIMFLDECVGAGEIAISDERGLNQSAQELAKLVRDTHVGGLLTGKCGLAHFHVGEESVRLQPLRDLVEDYQVKCDWLFPTHVQRNEKLLDEAIELATEGAFVNMDVVEEDLDKWLRYYVDHAGPLDKLSVSSDMDSSTPEIFYGQLCGLVVEHGFSLDMVLPLFTSNTARTLKLEKKGRVAAGHDADVVLLGQPDLDVRCVIAGGQILFRDGLSIVREKWIEKSKRSFAVIGDRHPSMR
jgi:beta-aspartyl-dipeptidase (metallo-type)